MSFVYRALQALFIVYENSFEVKTGKGHYKLSFETINVKIGSFLGSPGAKNCSKKVWNFINLSSQGSVDFVYWLWKNFWNQNGVEHYKVSFETINDKIGSF